MDWREVLEYYKDAVEIERDKTLLAVKLAGGTIKKTPGGS